MAQYAARQYRQGPQLLLAACDAELLGECYAEGRFRLEVKPGFYDGERIDEETLSGWMARCTVGNLVGEATVGLAVRLGFVESDNVLRVQGVPHAQFMVLGP